MKQAIHPVSSPTVFSCGKCGAQIAVASTKKADAKLDVCSNCHPVYTGKELKDVSGSRVQTFNDRYKSK